MHWGSWDGWCNLVELGDVEGGYSGHSCWSWDYRSFMGCQSLCHLSVKKIHTLKGCRNLRTMPELGLCWPAASAWSQLISSTFFSVIDPVYFWFSQLSASSLCIKHLCFPLSLGPARRLMGVMCGRKFLDLCRYSGVTASETNSGPYF